MYNTKHKLLKFYVKSYCFKSDDLLQGTTAQQYRMTQKSFDTRCNMLTSVFCATLYIAKPCIKCPNIPSCHFMPKHAVRLLSKPQCALLMVLTVL
jgi:hypothetical protein